MHENIPEDTTWENCTLRTWLNNDFYENAFTDTERAKIAITTVQDDKDPKKDTDPSIATKDKIFLLSITEAEKYFNSADTRACMPTEYAVGQGTSKWIKHENGACYWWLRSPGSFSHSAVIVCDDGSLYYSGASVKNNYDGVGVRPALWVNL